MAIIQPPGLRTARLYVWLLICSPALLFLSGAVLTGVGIGFDQPGVAVLGAAGVLAGLVLPRVVGRFDFGPRGVRADMPDIQLYTDLIQRGMEGGLTPGTAVEVAIDAAEDAGVGEAVQFWSHVARSAAELPSQALPMWNESVRRGLARQNLSEAIGLEGEVERVVQEVARQRNWPYRKDVTVSVGSERATADFVLETSYGQLLVEFAAIKRNPQALMHRINVLDGTIRRLNAWRGILVVPDGGIHGTPTPEVTVVEVSQLREALADVSD